MGVFLQSAGIRCHREPSNKPHAAGVFVSNDQETLTLTACIQLFTFQHMPFLLQNVAVKKVRRLSISAFNQRIRRHQSSFTCHCECMLSDKQETSIKTAEGKTKAKKNSGCSKATKNLETMHSAGQRGPLMYLFNQQNQFHQRQLLNHCGLSGL